MASIGGGASGSSTFTPRAPRPRGNARGRSQSTDKPLLEPTADQLPHGAEARAAHGRRHSWWGARERLRQAAPRARLTGGPLHGIEAVAPLKRPSDLVSRDGSLSLHGIEALAPLKRGQVVEVSPPEATLHGIEAVAPWAMLSTALKGGRARRRDPFPAIRQRRSLRARARARADLAGAPPAGHAPLDSLEICNLKLHSS